jgi:hypothetical protein
MSSRRNLVATFRSNVQRDVFLCFMCVDLGSSFNSLTKKICQKIIHSSLPSEVGRNKQFVSVSH